ncbi:hypothetical protein Droror1_Dr00015200 [Drosera rotundifolia]
MVAIDGDGNTGRWATNGDDVRGSGGNMRQATATTCSGRLYWRAQRDTVPTGAATTGEGWRETSAAGGDGDKLRETVPTGGGGDGKRCRWESKRDDAGRWRAAGNQQLAVVDICDGRLWR